MEVTLPPEKARRVMPGILVISRRSFSFISVMLRGRLFLAFSEPIKLPIEEPLLPLIPPFEFLLFSPSRHR